MEARKKKFEARSSVSEGKTKISLKTSQSTPSMALVSPSFHICVVFMSEAVIGVLTFHDIGDEEKGDQ